MLSCSVRSVGTAAGPPGALRLPQAPGTAPTRRASLRHEGRTRPARAPSCAATQGPEAEPSEAASAPRRVKESTGGRWAQQQPKGSPSGSAIHSPPRRKEKLRRQGRAPGRGGGRARTWRDLADGGRVPAVALVTVGRLDEDGAVAETLGEDLASDVVQPHAAP